MSDTPKFDRKKLAALLEEYGSSLASFEKLRKDSYELALAAQSLERLEQYYSQIFFPGRTAEQARPNCPPWPPGTESEGQLPSHSTINRTVERFSTEATLNGLGSIRAFLDQYRKSISQTILGDNDKVTEAVIALAGQELIKTTQAGKPLNLDIVDRLQYERRTKLKEREIATRERALDLLVKKYEDERAKVTTALKDDSLSAAEKEAAVKQIFGLS